MNDSIWRRVSSAPLMIRTDFSHDGEWTRLMAAVVEPQTEDEFEADVEFVDDKAFEGVTAAQLRQLVPADSRESFAFLADSQTFAHPDRPILVVQLQDWEEDAEEQVGEPGDDTTFRVIPSEMHSVENNLSLANMDWEEFADAVDDDGVFRGFPE
ncbi:DUF6924 domain-containing protein [Micromonospora sp. CA-259024]|uniref:DUF6924 domain-containing protein n=1 Tax=Micromonospora sp. CA-259024 TaxID=3239965 RepID=UPI003D93B56E